MQLVLFVTFTVRSESLPAFLLVDMKVNNSCTKPLQHILQCVHKLFNYIALLNDVNGKTLKEEK